MSQRGSVRSRRGRGVNAELPLNEWLGVFARAGARRRGAAVRVNFDQTRVASVGQPMFELAFGLSLR